MRAIKPDMFLLSQLDLRCVVITAPGTQVDFVSRCFGPKYGIPEDPVTGSSHCELAPYWGKRLGKNILTARQVSRRGGNLTCELKSDRVFLTGGAFTERARVFVESVRNRLLVKPFDASTLLKLVHEVLGAA